MHRFARIHVATRAMRWLVALVTILAVAPLSAAPLQQDGTNGRPSPRASALRIVVLEGEDAVNIVQQRTAVAPVVEVRDRNDQPVAGAVVRFAVRAGKATFRGARTISVTTNAAGRAAAEGLVPTGAGPLQIAATASYEGQTAAITIVQSNVATAAQVAGAGAGAGGGASGGAAAGSGPVAGAAAAAGSTGGAAGGLSATTLVIAGGAAAGGVVAATKVIGGDADSGSGAGPTKGLTYSGFFDGPLTQQTRDGLCRRNNHHSGTITIQLDSDAQPLTGQAALVGTYAYLSSTPGCQPAPGNEKGNYAYENMKVTGTDASLSFSGSMSGNTGVTVSYAFSGSRSNDTITGTYTESWIEQPSGFGGTTSFAVTLTKK